MNRRQWLSAVSGVAAMAGFLPTVAGAALRKPWRRQDPTPALQLSALDGSSWRLASEHGRPVLLNFWASWCEPCRTEMPSLERLAAMHRESGLKVLAINYRESEPAVQRFLDITSLTLPVLRDSDGAAARAFGVSIFPSTVAIDRTGRALFTGVGEIDWTDAEGQALVRSIL